MSYNRQTNYSATERELDRKAEEATGTIENVKEQAQETYENVKDKAQDLSTQVTEKADAATTTIGSQMNTLAHTIRENAPTSGRVADVADTAAHTLERAGTYLQEQDLTDMRVDIEDLIRRHPLEALLLGVGVGYLLARSMRR